MTHLALAAESPKQLIGLELGLLIGDDARHLEDEARFGLLVQTDGVERQHSGECRGVVHRVHVYRAEVIRPLCLLLSVWSNGKPPAVSHAYRSLTS